MAGLMSADDIFEKSQNAAAAATGPDEKAMQIDYPALKQKIRAALGDRRVALCHINKFLPEGYEDQGALILCCSLPAMWYSTWSSAIRICDHVVSVGQLDKVQVIDAMWDNKEKRREEPFLKSSPDACRRGPPLLALEDDERKSLLAFASAVSSVRDPERGRMLKNPVR